MIRLLIPLLTSLFISANAALAEPEVHVVGIYEGFSRTDGQVHGPKARVVLSRPDAEVVLVLISYTAVRWEVQLEGDTAEPSVVLAQLVDGGRRSEVWLNGKLSPSPVRMQLPLTYKPEGEDFRELVRIVPDLLGVPRMSSFSGSYSAEEIPFEIFAPVDDPRYDEDYLRHALSADSVPESLRQLIGPQAVARAPDVRLTENGFELLLPDGGTQVFALPLEMPEVSWPMGAVRDAETGTLYGVTLGGEGFLFAYDEAMKTWRIVCSMDGLDAQALFLDAKGRRLIMPLGFGSPGRFAVLDLRAGDAAAMQVVTLQDALPGYSDLYDPGNGPEPALVPVGIEGDKLLLLSQGDWRFGQRAPVGETVGPWRAYLADLSSLSVDLVGYDEAATNK
jgi:hypothetical protein